MSYSEESSNESVTDSVEESITDSSNSSSANGLNATLWSNNNVPQIINETNQNNINQNNNQNSNKISNIPIYLNILLYCIETLALIGLLLFLLFGYTSKNDKSDTQQKPQVNLIVSNFTFTEYRQCNVKSCSCTNVTNIGITPNCKILDPYAIYSTNKCNGGYYCCRTIDINCYTDSDWHTSCDTICLESIPNGECIYSCGTCRKYKMTLTHPISNKGSKHSDITLSFSCCDHLSNCDKKMLYDHILNFYNNKIFLDKNNMLKIKDIDSASNNIYNKDYEYVYDNTQDLRILATLIGCLLLPCITILYICNLLKLKKNNTKCAKIYIPSSIFIRVILIIVYVIVSIAIVNNMLNFTPIECTSLEPVLIEQPTPDEKIYQLEIISNSQTINKISTKINYYCNDQLNKCNLQNLYGDIPKCYYDKKTNELALSNLNYLLYKNPYSDTYSIIGIYCALYISSFIIITIIGIFILICINNYKK